MEKNIEILANREELIDRALEILLAKITEAIETRNQFTIALAGGSTPKPLYENYMRNIIFKLSKINSKKCNSMCLSITGA